MPKNRSLIKTARNVLNMQPKLHPLLFDENGIMFEHQRQKFMNLADLLIKKTFKTLQNYKIADIILAGSSASYFYNEESDFDVKILLDLSDNKAVGPNLKKFIKILNSTFYCSALKFRVDKHFVDMKFGIDEFYVMGNYSIMHRKWNIAPRNDFKIDDIKAETLIKMFYEATTFMYERISSLPFCNGFFMLEDTEEIRKIYDYFLIADQRVRANIDTGLVDFLAFKLIRKFHYLYHLADMEKQVTNDRLSLREEKFR